MSLGVWEGVARPPFYHFVYMVYSLAHVSITGVTSKNKTICQTNVPKVDAIQWKTYGKQTNKPKKQTNKANRNRTFGVERCVDGKPASTV